MMHGRGELIGVLLVGLLLAAGGHANEQDDAGKQGDCSLGGFGEWFEGDAAACEASLLLLLEAWAERQMGGEGGEMRLSLVVRPQYGLGNRMMSVISGLALALATDARLVVDWGEHFELLFQPPPFGWGDTRKVLRDAHRDTLMLDLTLHSKLFPQAASIVACGQLDKYRVVEVMSDQYFLPLVLLNKIAPPELRGPRGVVGWSDTVFRVLGRWLLRPSDQVETAVLGFEQSWGACAVGVHVRSPMFDWENAQVPKVESDVALKCAKHLLRNVSSSHTSSVFLAATSEAVRVEAERVLGSARVAYTKGPTERLMDSGEGERQALMDIVLLSRCKAFVSSVHSTFSYAAHALGGVTPWVVSSASEKGVSHAKSTGRSRCRQAAGPGPCFHGWAIVVNSLECYNASRDVAYQARPCWH